MLRSAPIRPLCRLNFDLLNIQSLHMKKCQRVHISIMHDACHGIKPVWARAKLQKLAGAGSMHGAPRAIAPQKKQGAGRSWPSLSTYGSGDHAEERPDPALSRLTEYVRGGATRGQLPSRRFLTQLRPPVRDLSWSGRGAGPALLFEKEKMRSRAMAGFVPWRCAIYWWSRSCISTVQARKNALLRSLEVRWRSIFSFIKKDGAQFRGADLDPAHHIELGLVRFHGIGSDGKW
jgi:hypothetical protein